MHPKRRIMMNISRKFPLILLVGLILVILGVAGCSSSLPAGQIKARLVAGDRKFNTVPVALIRFETSEPPAMDEVTEGKLYIGNTDEKGTILTNDLPSGYYMLALVQLPDGAFNIVYQEDEIFFFELPEGEGVDLGKVDVSNTRPLEGLGN
jgi:hypothetical protein